VKNVLARLSPLTVCLLAAGACVPEKKTVQDMWLPMGTFATVTVPGARHADLARCTKVAKDVFGTLEKDLSVYKQDSELSRVNRSAGAAPVQVSPHTRELLSLAKQYAELSDGSFDPTVAPLVKLWGFSGGKPPKAPLEKRAVNRALDLVDYRSIVVAKGSAGLGKPGMQLDLGGIAKGYAVDVCYRRLEAMGIDHVMVNLGGNIRCRGRARSDQPWKVGVRNPFDRDTIAGVIELPGGMAVATSGNYERFVMLNGERYTHIIDPRTGFPVKGTAGVTVISTTAVEADALSTALFVLGAEGSKAVLRRAPDCHALFIPDEQPLRMIATPGFMKYFKPDAAMADRLTVMTPD
jgi:thiamine biosynthesis lipoprotein